VLEFASAQTFAATTSYRLARMACRTPTRCPATRRDLRRRAHGRISGLVQGASQRPLATAPSAPLTHSRGARLAGFGGSKVTGLATDIGRRAASARTDLRRACGCRIVLRVRRGRDASIGCRIAERDEIEDFDVGG
jgi:hypothetical protein